MGLMAELPRNYVDKWGFLSCYRGWEDEAHTRGKHSENGLSWTSEYFIGAILTRNPDQKTINEWKSEWSDLVRQCRVKVGLYKREPHDKPQHQNGIDDYTCISTASHLFETTHARHIYEYGDNNMWMYNDQDPGALTLKGWFGRMPGFIVHLMECANMETSSKDKWLARVALDVSHYFNSGDGVAEDLKDRRLCFLNAVATSDPKLKARVKEILKDEYDSSIEKMYAKFFDVHFHNPNHPLVKMYQGYKF